MASLPDGPLAERGGPNVPARPTMFWALLLAVAVVLADSSVVTLALPDIVDELDVPVGRVTWVLTSYNLVLALAALPAAWLVSRMAGAARAALAGLVVFAVACVGCALAGSLEVLIAARVVQALGGALLVTAALVLLISATGTQRRGGAVWAASGVAGTAIGPFAGGVLTEVFAWQAIFVVQVPLVLLAIPAIRAVRADPPRPEDAAPAPSVSRSASGYGPRASAGQRLASDATLLLLSAALTAALFLIVLLLIEGWRRSPITAALAVTVMPAAAIATRAFVTSRDVDDDDTHWVLPGAVLTAGGLASLGLLPGAGLGWVVLPQLLIGAGLALTIEPLTARAVESADPLRQGGRNLTVRHLGIVVGLALLTPIFLDGLDRAEPPATQAVTALVVDSRLPSGAKLSLAESLTDALATAGSRIPDLTPAFEGAEVEAADRPEATALQDRVDDQLDRAATGAFQNAFLAASALAALAAIIAAASQLSRLRARPSAGAAA